MTLLRLRGPRTFAGVALRADALPAQAGMEGPVRVQVPLVLQVGRGAQRAGLEVVAEVGEQNIRLEASA